MLKSGVSHVVHGIERFLDLMPEPLVLRALEAPDRQLSRKKPAARGWTLP